MRLRAGALTALLAGCAPLLAACGADEGASDSGRLVVSAAASLQTAFTSYAERAGIDARQSFAGSDELAAQIRQGVTPDVFASADTALPGELHDEGLVGRPVVFATNSVVVAVPQGSAIDSLDELAEPGVTVAIGDPAVPVGSYAREALGRLPSADSEAILANVGSQEPDASGIVGKVTQGAVDAGFVYATDVAATGGQLEAVTLPGALQPDVAYGAAVVEGAAEPGEARRFIAGLLRGEGAEALAGAGFGPPPG